MKHIIILTTLILFSALLNAEENKNIDLIVKENSTSIKGDRTAKCFWDTSNKIYDVSGFKWKVQ